MVITKWWLSSCACCWRAMATEERRREGDWEEEIGHFLIFWGRSVTIRLVGIAVLVVWRRVREKKISRVNIFH